MNPIKVIHKYVLTGALSNGKFLIPAPPKRISSQFILFIMEEQQKIKTEREKFSQQDLVKLLKIQYHERTKEQNDYYKNQYDQQLMRYEQQKLEYDWKFHFQRQNKFQSWQASFRRMIMSEKCKKNSNDPITILESRERFRNNQKAIENDLGNATQDQIVLAQQLAHLASLRAAQINVHMKLYKVPKLFNTKAGKVLSQHYLKTYYHYNSLKILFREYLESEITPEQLAQYDNEMKKLAEILQGDPSHLEFAIAYQLCNCKRKNEEKVRKRRRAKSNEKFLNLLTEYFEKD